MIEMKLSELFKNQTISRLLECFLENPESYFTLSQLAQVSGTSVSTVIERIRELEKFGIVKKIITRKIKLYKLNAQSKLAQILLEFYSKLKMVKMNEHSVISSKKN